MLGVTEIRLEVFITDVFQPCHDVLVCPVFCVFRQFLAQSFKVHFDVAELWPGRRSSMYWVCGKNKQTNKNSCTNTRSVLFFV